MGSRCPGSGLRLPPEQGSYVLFRLGNAHALTADFPDGGELQRLVRELQQGADAYVRTIDQPLEEAFRAVAATLELVSYGWDEERPTTTPGSGGITLSIFDGDGATAKAYFRLEGGSLRWTTEADGGWVYCWYTADEAAWQTLLDALQAING